LQKKIPYLQLIHLSALYENDSFVGFDYYVQKPMQKSEQELKMDLSPTEFTSELHY
jgi:hypothetical protein